MFYFVAVICEKKITEKHCTNIHFHDSVTIRIISVHVHVGARECVCVCVCVYIYIYNIWHPFHSEVLNIETLLHQKTSHCGFLHTINSSTYQCMTIIITPETITK
jgi:hypothetical protein